MYARVTGQEEVTDSCSKSRGSTKSTPSTSPYSARSSKSSSKSSRHEDVVDIIDEDGFRYIPFDLKDESDSENGIF